MARAILVTGAAGFAGSHLLDLLAGKSEPTAGSGSGSGFDSASDSITGWHRPGRTPPSRGPAVAWTAVDLLNRPSVIDAIARLRPAIVYHCAGAAHVGQAWERTEATLSANVRGTHHVLEGLRRAGTPARVLIPSSALVYRPANEPLTEDHPLVPTSPYGLAKLAQELLASHAGSNRLEITIARAFNHFGRRQDPAFSTSAFARQIASIEAGLQPPEISVGNLEARRDLTDVRDTVRAYRLIAERGRPGRAYNVCSGRAIAIRDVLDMLVARSHVTIRVQVDPERFRPNDVPLLLGDPRRVREELGWSPELPLEQTLEDILEHWRGKIR